MPKTPLMDRLHRMRTAAARPRTGCVGANQIRSYERRIQCCIHGCAFVPAGGAYRAPALAHRRARDRRGPGARHAPGVGPVHRTRGRNRRGGLRRLHGGKPGHHHRARRHRRSDDAGHGKRRARLRHRAGRPLLRPGPRLRRRAGRGRVDPPPGRPRGGVRLERAHRRGRARAGEDRRHALWPAARDRPHRHVRQPHHPRPGGVGDPRDDRGAGGLLR